MRKSFDKLRLNGNSLVPLVVSLSNHEHVGRKSDSAFRQRSVHTAEGAGKKPPAFSPYVLRIGRGQA